MLEVVQQQDGRFAVRELGGAALMTTLAVFATEVEADEWMLAQSLTNRSGLHVMRPGSGQGPF